MTQTPLAPAPAPVTGRLRSWLRTLAIISCLPYIVLKAAWISGSRIGMPEGSSLLDHRTTMIVANGISVLMDSAVVVIALLLTQSWGRRVPAWPLVLPMWVATGLLLPIMTGYPLQLLVQALGGEITGSGGSARPFLDEWVFAVVYTGFIIQGLTLGTLFALYAKDRWGHLWQGTLRELPASPTAPALRAAAVAASLVALIPGTMHLLWAAGSTAGLNEALIAESNSGSRVVDAVDVLFAAAAVAGVVLLAFRRNSALPLRVPLALAWGGSGAVGCWGGWMGLAALSNIDDMAHRPTPALVLTYAVQMLVGTLVVTLGAYFLTERAAGTRPPSGLRA
ncbi:hypothetical protein OG322_29905 [Streptomyces sp. NBC_01260]|uniref:hypothetical protein n=1 Tax=unclassified Streptomyces TaxID=2593676 RepID=UPI000F47F259|nr:MULTISPECIES: hypothetical protein [unclassified Streptomyces]MCX4773377.1 hypothetical protein [Streptomyces sp. NBC_01285]ROQ74055.1 hypothetical protein EDD95_6748 [Streptomyces sp. CEV 2-1]RPK52982.1 hypothetical protein EES39_00475 [Streptomyces sp. ADI92-24]